MYGVPPDNITQEDSIIVKLGGKIGCMENCPQDCINNNDWKIHINYKWRRDATMNLTCGKGDNRKISGLFLCNHATLFISFLCYHATCGKVIIERFLAFLCISNFFIKR